MSVLPENEAERLAALRGYAILDSEPEPAFDDLTRLVAQVCGVPIALISLVDETRQWFKSRHGLDATETGRNVSFCAHAILQTELCHVPDAQADPRFAANPLVTGEPHIRFYAGVPLVNADRLAIGTLCVIDRQPRQLTPEQQTGLTALARQVISQIELRHSLAAQRRSQERLELAVRGTSDGLWDYDLRTREIYYSPRWKAMLGYAEAELENTLETWERLVHSEDRDAAHAGLRNCFAEGAANYEAEFRMRHKNGSDRWMLSRGVVLRDERGEPVRLVGANTDITERKRATTEMEAYIEERTGNLRDAIEFMQQEIAERAKAEQEVISLNRQLEKRLQRIAALRQIDMAISASLDLRHTLDIFLDQVLHQLQMDAADVLICNPYAHQLEYSVGKGFQSNALRHTRLKIGAGHAGKAALERVLVHIKDLRLEPGSFTNTPILASEQFVTYFAVPLVAKGQVKGVLEMFSRQKMQPDFEWLDFLETLAGQAAIAIDNAQMFEGLQRSNLELTLAYDATIEGWSRALDLRDHETEGHTQRVTALTLELAREMGLSENELVSIRRGALLHDIGKVGIPDAILHKPGKLTEEEREIMCQHTQYAYEMLAPIAFLRSAIDIPYCHHEKWDGTGYPRGLKGEQIPLAARLFSMVDVWDALRSERSYKKAWSEAEACAQIQSMAGTHFDPKIVAVFLRTIARYHPREDEELPRAA